MALLNYTVSRMSLSLTLSLSSSPFEALLWLLNLTESCLMILSHIEAVMGTLDSLCKPFNFERRD